MSNGISPTDGQGALRPARKNDAAAGRRVRGLAVALCLLVAALLFPAGASATPTFLSPLDWSDAGQDAFDPDMAEDASGNLLVVWTRSDGSNTRIQARMRTAAGALGSTQTVSDPGQNASEAQVAFDAGGNALVVWSRSDGANTRVQAAFRPAGGSFGVPQTLSAAGQSASAPQVSFDHSGKAIAVWTRFDTGGSAVIQTALRPAGGSFGAVSTLSVPGQVAYEPQVAAGPNVDQNGAVVWTRPDGVKLRVQSSRRVDVPGFVRPKGATPVRVALVTAFNACTTPNRLHAAPLSFGSCNPPVKSSSVLTVGTPDVNTFAANLIGSLRLDAILGDTNTAANEADVSIVANVTDVRNHPSGSDYVGRMLFTTEVQITDNNNDQETPSPATVTTIPFQFPIDCVATGDTTVGSSCSLTTTANALAPDTIVERLRNTWQLGQVQVKDAGPNGTGYASCPPTCGDGDETVFLRGGIFVP